MQPHVAAGFSSTAEASDPFHTQISASDLQEVPVGSSLGSSAPAAPLGAGHVDQNTAVQALEAPAQRTVAVLLCALSTACLSTSDVSWYLVFSPRFAFEPEWLAKELPLT